MSSIVRNSLQSNINPAIVVKDAIYFNLTTDIIKNNCNFTVKTTIWPPDGVHV